MGRKAPKLSICMIVRDEEANLPRALSSVQGLWDELVVADTGSRDGTVAVAQAHGARVLHIPWTDDFAAARNAGIAQARGDWIMVLDADEELTAADRARVRPLLHDAQAEGYICPVVSLVGSDSSPDYEQSFLLRFWRNRPGYRYTGFMHEDLAPSIFAEQPAAQLLHAPIRFVHYGYLASAEEARAKKQRNLALIEREVARDPNSPYYRFNLGVEYQRHDRFDEALAQYREAAPHAAGKPWAPKLTKNLVYCLLATQRWEEAAAQLAAALEQYPDFTDLLYFRGIVEFEQGHFPKSVATFSQCVAMGPAPVPPYAGAEEGLGAWKALYALGRAYHAAGRPHEALGAYEQAHNLSPRWLAPLEAITAVLLAAGVAPEKVQGYVQERLPEDLADRDLVVADLLAQGGAPGVALASIPAAVPASAAGWASYLRGYCHLKSGDWATAARELSRVPPGDRHRPAALAGLVYCYWCQGEMAAMEEAMTALGDDQAARQKGARLFIAAARETLEAGLARFPDAGPLRSQLEQVRRETL